MLNRSALRLALVLIVSVNVFAQNSSNASAPSNQNPSLELAQQGAVKLAVKAMIIDRDLNVKPIPKFVFSLERIADQASHGETLTLTTKIDGTIETQVSPGRYRIASARPLDFEGKHYSWDIQFNAVPPETILELSNDNAKIAEGGPSPVDDLVSVFKKYRDTVVTVWVEVGAGHGTGFIADPAGLVITNQHVVTTSEYIAVQFDQEKMLPATLLASDPTKDVAVLWVNLSNVTEARAAPLLARETYLQRKVRRYLPLAVLCIKVR